MTRITTPKLQSLEPTWAPFGGWSALLDNPGVSGRVDGLVEHLDCPRGCCREQRMFDELDDWASSFFSGPFRGVPHARLPRSTYHVTLADGLNTSHLDTLRGGWSTSLGWPERANRVFQALLGPLPDGIELRMVGVELRGHAVMALLEPSGPEAAASKADLDRRRRLALEELGRECGLDLLTEWEPHVTLAYIADRADRSRGRAILEDEAAPAGSSVRFESVSLYQFRSMVAFWRRAPGAGR